MQTAFQQYACGQRQMLIRLGAGLLGLAMPALAIAAEPPPANLPTLEIALPAQWSTVHERDVTSLGAPVGASRLHDMRGGEDDGSASLIIIDGKVEDNTANNVFGGSNTIGGGSFDGASGINTIIQNSGTNVLIQSATIVNVNFGGTPL